MERYRETAEIIRHNGNGKRRYETIYFPNYPNRSTDIYIITRRLDRLDNLAFQYYEDTRLWWVIQRANSLPGGTFQIPAGMRLRIPFPVHPFDAQTLLSEYQS